MKTTTKSWRSIWAWTMLGVVTCFLFLLSACGPTRIAGWSQQSYRSENLSKNSLKQGRLALLPVILLSHAPGKSGGRNEAIPPAPYTPYNGPGIVSKGSPPQARGAYQPGLNGILLSSLRSRWPWLHVVPPSEVLKELNDGGMTEVYRRLVRDYPKTGLNTRTLKSLGRVLRCRYVLVVEAVVSTSSTDASVTFVWTFGRRSILRSVQLFGQIWDTMTGRQIWEGCGVGYNRLGAYEKAPLFEALGNRAADSLLTAVIP